MIIFLWLALFTVFSGSYVAYFAYLKRYAGKPWQLRIDEGFSPSISILVPARNEEKVIQKKLENLLEVLYPKEKMEIIVIDDASKDGTLAKVHDFMRNHPELQVKVLSQRERIGKANALNKGLKVTSNEIVIVSDADSFWSPDLLRKGLPYMADPRVGAITGRGVALNTEQSWVVDMEKNYLDLMLLLRLGESKIHSTIRFEGSFCVFRRNAFSTFDSESGADDSGTALRVVQDGFRAIFVPEAYAASDFPSKFRTRMKAKVRRAFHLTGLWLKCFKYLLKGCLRVPKRIAIPEIFLLIINPIIFVALTVATFALIAYYPIVLIPLLCAFCVVGLIPKARSFAVQGTIDQFVLFYAIILHLGKKKIVAWEK